MSDDRRDTGVSDDAASSPPATTGPVRAPIVLLVCGVGMVIVLLAGTLLFGASSHASPSGSLDGAVEAAREDYRLAGVNVDALYFSAEKSLVDPHWAKFTAAPAVGNEPAPSYGYELFASHRWTVVDAGTQYVGCARPGRPGAVPRDIISSFGMACPN